MAYSRFGYADVYVFTHVGGFLQCCGCWLGDEWDFHSTEDMIAHLALHRAAGHNVPDGLEEVLREDDEDNFPLTCRDGHAPGEPYHPYADRGEPLSHIVRRDCIKCGWDGIE